ncbi:MAG: hypothetical protein HY815_24715 [Candidatus Riflebacteria bacterium]|nr:hypothetical protein [Candidatus Riflebacteria bacterium]
MRRIPLPFVMMLLALATLLQAGRPSSSCKDVPPTDPDRPVIVRLLDDGVLKTIDGQFFPEKRVDRYQAAVTFAWLMDRLGLEKRPAATALADVPKDHWAHDAVVRTCPVLDLGIDGRFDGPGLLSRPQLDSACRRLAAAACLTGFEIPPGPGGAVVSRRVLARYLGALLVRHDALIARVLTPMAALQTSVIETADELAALNTAAIQHQEGKSPSPLAKLQQQLRTVEETVSRYRRDLAAMEFCITLRPADGSMVVSPQDRNNLLTLVTEFQEEIEALRKKLRM